MIDIHSHILPAVDDGSVDAATSLKMLTESKCQGITDIVLTPHYRADYLTDRVDLEEKFQEFKATVQAAGIDVGLYLGQEIYAFDGVADAIENGKLLTLNGTKYVLIEFSLSRETDIVETVYGLITKGFIPIVAHIDRYFYADVETAREVKDIGGLVQINAGTVCNSGGQRRKAFAMIKEGLVDFVASDVHSKRVNYMEKAYKIVKKKFGDETANKLFNENAKILINK